MTSKLDESVEKILSVIENEERTSEQVIETIYDEDSRTVYDAIYDEAYLLVEKMSFQDALLFLADKEGWAENLFSELHSLMSDITDYTKEQILNKI